VVCSLEILLRQQLHNHFNVRWDFGDGTESNEWSPFHKYEKAGTYRVCLKIAFFEGCTKEVCKTVVVPEPLQL
jgi:PKD repeat protein